MGTTTDSGCFDLAEVLCPPSPLAHELRAARARGTLDAVALTRRPALPPLDRDAPLPSFARAWATARGHARELAIALEMMHDGAHSVGDLAADVRRLCVHLEADAVALADAAARERLR